MKDSLKYSYDKMGNIEKVYENGELAIRYHYDALNRLVREDNKILDKTALFVYDNNGNLLKQRLFAFTLKNATDTVPFYFIPFIAKDLADGHMTLNV